MSLSFQPERSRLFWYNQPMTNEQERYCTSCKRVYSWGDWQEDTCPFCDVPLKAADGSGQNPLLLDDTLSTEIEWPQGEREVQVYKASGFMDAQLIKAQLESAGIPVLLHAGAKLGFVVGDLGAVPIYVPKSRQEEANEILSSNPD